MAAKLLQDMTAEEQELQEFVREFSIRRVLKILQSRKRQLERQRTSEYRDQQAARSRAAKEADRKKIIELTQQLAKLRGQELNDDEEHAA